MPKPLAMSFWWGSATAPSRVKAAEQVEADRRRHPLQRRGPEAPHAQPGAAPPEADAPRRAAMTIGTIRKPTAVANCTHDVAGVAKFAVPRSGR